MECESDVEDETKHPFEAKKRKREVLKEVYVFEYTEKKEKFAKCKICLNKTNKEKIVKMKDGNTTGIIRHLRNYHLEEFSKVFPEANNDPSPKVILFLLYKSINKNK